MPSLIIATIIDIASIHTHKEVLHEWMHSVCFHAKSKSWFTCPSWQGILSGKVRPGDKYRHSLTTAQPHPFSWSAFFMTVHLWALNSTCLELSYQETKDVDDHNTLETQSECEDVKLSSQDLLPFSPLLLTLSFCWFMLRNHSLSFYRSDFFKSIVL